MLFMIQISNVLYQVHKPQETRSLRLNKLGRFDCSNCCMQETEYTIQNVTSV